MNKMEVTLLNCFLILAALHWQTTVTEAVMCYTCDHVAHPRDCDRVVECKADESCHVISYAQPDGHFYYVTGCLATSSCPANPSGFGKRDIAFCNRCCTDNYCNKELCDGPPPAPHGPRCLQCTTVEDPTHCGAVTECAHGEYCYTKEKYVFGELRYQLGCANQGCTARTFRDLTSKRAGLCEQCCTGENCNRNLCHNTGSSLTQRPVTVASAIPTTVTQSTSSSGHHATAMHHTSDPGPHTTFKYNLHGCVYKGKTYHEGETWEEDCDFRCSCVEERTGKYVCQDICPTYVNVPTECKMEALDGECCKHPVCLGTHIHLTNFTTTNYTSSILVNNCYYKGKVYYQDDTWRDGCEYDCHCVDATKGYYRCTSLCYTWNLPKECHLQSPAAGKCCETPSCPPHFTINYPPGYVEN